MNEKYSKIIIARHSPENKCFVSEGDPLYVKPLKSIPIRNVTSHHFLSLLDFKTKSKYGWVHETDNFIFDEFIEKYFSGKELNELQLQAVKMMLDSIAKLEINTPVTSTYFERGVIEKKMVLTVHRVFFYYPKV